MVNTSANQTTDVSPFNVHPYQACFLFSFCWNWSQIKGSPLSEGVLKKCMYYIQYIVRLGLFGLGCQDVCSGCVWFGCQGVRLDWCAVRPSPGICDSLSKSEQPFWCTHRYKDTHVRIYIPFTFYKRTLSLVCMPYVTLCVYVVLCCSGRLGNPSWKDTLTSCLASWETSVTWRCCHHGDNFQGDSQNKDVHARAHTHAQMNVYTHTGPHACMTAWIHSADFTCRAGHQGIDPN